MILYPIFMIIQLCARIPIRKLAAGVQGSTADININKMWFFCLGETQCTEAGGELKFSSDPTSAQVPILFYFQPASRFWEL